MKNTKNKNRRFSFKLNFLNGGIANKNISETNFLIEKMSNEISNLKNEIAKNNAQINNLSIAFKIYVENNGSKASVKKIIAELLEAKVS